MLIINVSRTNSAAGPWFDHVSVESVNQFSHDVIGIMWYRVSSVSDMSV